MSESGKVSLPMTPERIEAYKTMIHQLGALPPSAANELLTALEESQQAITVLHDYNHRYAKERDEAKRDLAEAQQTIARIRNELSELAIWPIGDPTDEVLALKFAFDGLRKTLGEGAKES